MKKQTYTLSALFPERNPAPAEISADIDRQRAFHAAGNLDPQLTVQRIICCMLEFKAPISPLIPTEPDTNALQAARRFLLSEIYHHYGPGQLDIRWKLQKN